jgi:hypothetical protein
VSKISPGFQNLISCPGHFIFFLLLKPIIAPHKNNFIDLCHNGLNKILIPDGADDPVRG